MRVILDCANMTDKASAHAYLKQALNFPEYYGNNLDALFDVLSSWQTPLVIAFINENFGRENLGAYFDGLLQTILDAATENPAVTVLCSQG